MRSSTEDPARPERPEDRGFGAPGGIDQEVANPDCEAVFTGFFEVTGEAIPVGRADLTVDASNRSIAALDPFEAEASFEFWLPFERIDEVEANGSLTAGAETSEEVGAARCIEEIGEEEVRAVGASPIPESADFLGLGRSCAAFDPEGSFDELEGTRATSVGDRRRLPFAQSNDGHLVEAAQGDEAEAGRQLSSQSELVEAPVVHRGAGVEKESKVETALCGVLLDMEFLEATVGVPVDRAKVVSRRVRTMFPEFSS